MQTVPSVDAAWFESTGPDEIQALATILAQQEDRGWEPARLELGLAEQDWCYRHLGDVPPDILGVPVERYVQHASLSVLVLRRAVHTRADGRASMQHQRIRVPLARTDSGLGLEIGDAAAV